MRDKRRKRKKRIISRCEQKAIDHILRAAFIGDGVYIYSSLLLSSDNKKYPVIMAGPNNKEFMRFYVTADVAHSVLKFNTNPISAREAMKFFNKNKACAVYPRFD